MSFVLFPFTNFVNEPDSSTTVARSPESVETLQLPTNGTTPPSGGLRDSTDQLPIVTITLILLTGFLTGYIIKDAVKFGAVILRIRQSRQRNEPLHKAEDGLIKNEKGVLKECPDKQGDKLLDENLQEFRALKADFIKNAEGQKAAIA